jgi:hypothetical protein
MIPIRTVANAKFVPNFRTCFQCDQRLSRHGNHSKKFCLDCEAAQQRAIKAARRSVQAAIARGDIRRAIEFACVDCSRPAFCYDHRDYSKPLQIEPVCKSCNTKRGPGRLGTP